LEQLSAWEEGGGVTRQGPVCDEKTSRAFGWRQRAGVLAAAAAAAIRTKHTARRDMYVYAGNGMG